MSEVDTSGLAASAAQLADTGFKLSVDLHIFTRTIKPTDVCVNALPYDVDFVDILSHRIAATSAVLQQLGHVLSDQKNAQLCSSQAAATTQGLIDECTALFDELIITVDPVTANNSGNRHTRSSARVVNLKRKLNFTYLKSQVVELKANLDRLKSGLLVVSNSLVLAEQLRSREAAPILNDQQNLLKLLVEENAIHEKRYRDIVGPTVGGNATDDKNDDSIEPAVSPFQVRLVDSVDLTAFTHQERSEGTVVNTENHKFPEGLRRHYRQIMDSGELVENLLQQIDSSEYKIDPTLRSALHNRVLDCHWDCWFGMRSVHGAQVFLDCYSDLEEVARFWSDQKSFDDRDEKVMQEKIKKNEFARSLWEEYANSQPRRRVLPAVKDSLAVDNREFLTDMERPTWIRIHRNHVLPETLNAYRLKWDYDSTDQNYVIIKEYIDDMLQREIFEHTKKVLCQTTESVSEDHTKKTANVGEPLKNRTSGTALEPITEEDAPTSSCAKQDDQTSGEQTAVYGSRADDGRGSEHLVSQVDEVQSNTPLASTLPTSGNHDGPTNDAPGSSAIKSPLTSSWASDNGDDILSISLEGNRVGNDHDAPTTNVTDADIQGLVLRFSNLSDEQVKAMSSKLE